MRTELFSGFSEGASYWSLGERTIFCSCLYFGPNTIIFNLELELKKSCIGQDPRNQTTLRNLSTNLRNHLLIKKPHVSGMFSCFQAPFPSSKPNNAGSPPPTTNLHLSTYILTSFDLPSLHFSPLIGPIPIPVD
jgi:hypothetical protein